MDTQSTPSKCQKSKSGRHKFIKDLGDKRFKVCSYCGKIRYRTDEEVMENKP